MKPVLKAAAPRIVGDHVAATVVVKHLCNGRQTLVDIMSPIISGAVPEAGGWTV
jgi:hypothetical protein